MLKLFCQSVIGSKVAQDFEYILRETVLKHFFLKVVAFFFDFKKSHQKNSMKNNNIIRERLGIKQEKTSLNYLNPIVFLSKCGDCVSYLPQKCGDKAK